MTEGEGVLRRLKPDIFVPGEAKEKLCRPIETGGVAYAKLPISHKNNMNNRRAYEKEYHCRMREVLSKGTYVQSFVVIGQFVCLCVDLKKEALLAFANWDSCSNRHVD